MDSLNRPPLKLVFGTPEFLPEGVVQSTVRVGQKWRDDLNGKVAPRIPCVDLEGTVLGTATVVGTLFGSFKDFGYIGSTVNHQEEARDIDGLIDVLTECYPGFNPETDQVTVIFFKYASTTPVEFKVIDEAPVQIEGSLIEAEEKSEDGSEVDSEDSEGSDGSESDDLGLSEASVADVGAALDAEEAEAQAKADAESEAESEDASDSAESSDDSSNDAKTDEETKVES